MLDIRNQVAFSVSSAVYEFFAKLNQYISFVKDSDPKLGELGEKNLLTSFKREVFPEFTNLLGLIKEEELSRGKVEKINRLLEYFSGVLRKLDFKEEISWNFFDSALSILLTDIKKTMEKPVIQVEMFKFYRRTSAPKEFLVRIHEKSKEEVTDLRRIFESA